MSLTAQLEELRKKRAELTNQLQTIEQKEKTLGENLRMLEEKVAIQELEDKIKAKHEALEKWNPEKGTWKRD